MTKFDPHADLILVEAVLTGPRGPFAAKLILDIGANVSAIDPVILEQIGLDPSKHAVEVFEVFTASGRETRVVVQVASVEAIKTKKPDLLMVCHSVPPHSGAYGVLGLDFIRDRRLTIDMTKGTLRLK